MPKWCPHARTGIVTNQPDWLLPGGEIDLTQNHAARDTCDRPECIKAAKQWVAATANATAYYVPDADRTVRR